MDNKKIKKTIKIWWEEASGYYQKNFNIPINDIYYGPFCPTERELKIINLSDVKNKKILELGCGGGQNGIVLSKNHAIYTGIDISKNQIKYAKNLAKIHNLKINYSVGSAEKLTKFKSNEFDIVLSIFSFQYVRNLQKCFQEVNRVLKDKGLFIFSIDHPFYSVLSPTTLKLEQAYNFSGYRRTIKTSDIIESKKWPKGNQYEFFFYFRNISEICRLLKSANFIVEEIKEPVSFNFKDPWKKIYSKELAKHVPPTIIFISKKNKKETR